jgi:hypothetical protein
MRILAAILVGGIVWPASGQAQEPPYVPPIEHAVLLAAGELVWHPDPDGTEVAVLYGNPAQEGPYALRVRFPADWEMPFHWHPASEFTTVLEGTLHLALGRDARRQAATAYGPGSFFAIPAFVPIWAWTGNRAVVVQVHGMGPLVTVPIADGH